MSVAPKIVQQSKYSLLENGITTRIMSKRVLSMQKENEETNGARRRSSKFLSGTFIPNSTIRSSLQSDELKEQLLKMPTKVDSEIEEKEASIREDLENVNRIEERALQRMREKFRTAPQNKTTDEATKERKRSSTVSELEKNLPNTKRRRSTLESIRHAIENSPKCDTKLVNADSIERRNLSRNFYSNQPKIEKHVISKRDLQTQTSLTLGGTFPFT